MRNLIRNVLVPILTGIGLATIIILLASVNPLYLWTTQPDVGPQRDVIVLREAEYESTAAFEDALNALKTRGYTVRAGWGGLGGGRCVMEVGRE